LQIAGAMSEQARRSFQYVLQNAGARAREDGGTRERAPPRGLEAVIASRPT
jgi:hypothetical protein